MRSWTNLNARCAASWPIPERWRRIRSDNRKLNFDRFPYAIIYSVGAEAIYIKAVMHLYRRPFYWKARE